jgi:hypothetical protein
VSNHQKSEKPGSIPAPGLRPSKSLRTYFFVKAPNLALKRDTRPPRSSSW